MKRLAVIDMGAHTIHLDIFEIQKGRIPVPIYTKSELSHLGRCVASSPDIHAIEKSHLKVSLLRLMKKARKKKADPILIVATAGIRNATNGHEVINELQKTIKHPIHLLKSDRESELGFLGIRSELKPHAVQLFLDCGGGSSEVTLARGRKRLGHVTLPFGSDTLCTQIQNNPPRMTDLLRITKSWAGFYSSLPSSPRPVRALARGSSIKKILELIPKGISDTLQLEHIHRVMLKLLRKTSKKIEHKYGIQEGCVAPLVPAGLFLAMMLDHYHLDQTGVSDKGLRDGVAIDYLKYPAHWS